MGVPVRAVHAPLSAIPLGRGLPGLHFLLPAAFNKFRNTGDQSKERFPTGSPKLGPSLSCSLGLVLVSNTNVRGGEAGLESVF